MRPTTAKSTAFSAPITDAANQTNQATAEAAFAKSCRLSGTSSTTWSHEDRRQSGPQGLTNNKHKRKS
eukprot:2127604-Amphidinium_carterae.2